MRRRVRSAIVLMAALALLAYRRTHHIALHDALTGLPTRAGFHDALAREIERRSQLVGARVVQRLRQAAVASWILFLNSSVLALSSAFASFSYWGSRALIFSTSGCMRRISRSFLVPTIFLIKLSILSPFW